MSRWWLVLCVTGALALVPVAPASTMPDDRPGAASSAAAPLPQPTFCAPIGRVIAVAPRRGTSRRVVDAVVDELVARRPYVEVRRVALPSVGSSLPRVFDRFAVRRQGYERSLRAGRKRLLSKLSVSSKNSCGGQPTVLVGHGLGAHVVGDVVQDGLSRTERLDVPRAVLLGDPRFKGDQRGAPPVGSFDATKDGAWGKVGDLREIDADDRDVFRTFCVKGDPVCNLSPSKLDACLRRPARCPHGSYDTARFEGSTYTRAAGRALSQRLQAPTPPAGSVTTVAQLPPLPSGATDVTRADLSADGRFAVFAADPGDGRVVVRVWSSETATWTDVGVSANPRTAPAISADGRFVAYVGSVAGGAGAVQVWDRSTAGLVDELVLTGPPQRVSNLELSANGQVASYLVVGSGAAGDAYRWDRAGGPPARLTDGLGHAERPVLSADGQHLAFEDAVPSSYRQVCVWDAGIGITCFGHPPPRASAISGTGRFVGLGNEVLDRATGSTMLADDCTDCGPLLLNTPGSFSVDGRFYAYASEGYPSTSLAAGSAVGALVLLDAETQQNVFVDESSLVAAQPHVSDDGRRVLYVRSTSDPSTGTVTTNLLLWTRH